MSKVRILTMPVSNEGSHMSLLFLNATKTIGVGKDVKKQTLAHYWWGCK